MNSINRRWTEKLQDDPICSGSKLVLGEGKTDAPVLMLIGEAPGAQEEAQGRPFVGQAGRNLNGFLATLGLERREIYITNTVKLRPSVIGKSGKEKNRPPKQNEIDAFVPWLYEEIDRVRPQLIVTLGNTPLRAICGKGMLIGQHHGTLLTTPWGLPLYALYHPAAVIYDRSLRAVYEQDLIQLKSLIQYGQAALNMI